MANESFLLSEARFHLTQRSPFTVHNGPFTWARRPWEGRVLYAALLASVTFALYEWLRRCLAPV